MSDGSYLGIHFAEEKIALIKRKLYIKLSNASTEEEALAVLGSMIEYANSLDIQPDMSYIADKVIERLQRLGAPCPDGFKKQLLASYQLQE